MKTAKQYFVQILLNKSLESLTRAGEMSTGSMDIREFTEDNSNRHIIVTEYKTDRLMDCVDIYPSYAYYENNLLGDNKGSRIDSHERWEKR